MVNLAVGLLLRISHIIRKFLGSSSFPVLQIKKKKENHQLKELLGQDFLQLLAGTLGAHITHIMSYTKHIKKKNINLIREFLGTDFLQLLAGTLSVHILNMMYYAIHTHAKTYVYT